MLYIKWMIRIAQNCIVFLLIFSFSVSYTFTQKLPFRNLLEKDGLPSPIVYCINQDTHGYLWFGTDKGVSRFNGAEFENFNKNDGLAGNRVYTIAAARNGDVWFGTEKNGASCFTPVGFKNFDNLSGTSVYTIIEDKAGKLWFATSRGLFCYSETTFRHYTTKDGLHTDSLFNFGVDKNGVLWYGTVSGIGRLSNGKFTIASIGGRVRQNTISSLLMDSRGNLWIGIKKGLLRYSNDTLSTFTQQDGLCHNAVTSIMEDSEGNIWLGTWNGASLYSGNKFTNFTTKNGLSDNFVYSLFQDREGNTWFGTHGGVSCLTSLKTKTYTTAEGLPNRMVFDIVQDKKNRYWFATSEGLSCFSGGVFKNYTTQDGLPSSIINNVTIDREDNIWVSTPQGLSILSSGSFSNYTMEDGLSSNIIFETFFDRDGNAWIGTSIGLSRYNNGQFTQPPFNSILDRVFHVLVDVRGNLWFSSQDKLFKHSGQQLTSYSNYEGLPNRDIKSLFEDSKHNLWIGSEGGLSCFDGQKFTLYTSKNSNLPDNTCYFVMEDSRNCLWIGTSKGLTCFDGKTFKTYTSERLGLSRRSWRSGIKDNHGKLWFGTTEGVTEFFPPPIKPNMLPPPIYITGVKVMEEEVPINQTGQFGYDENIIRFNFVGISFSASTGVNYKYRMENIDNDWQTTRDRSLFYPFLPPGAYTLQIKAVNIDGTESEKPATYTFNIQPPFWQTAWFLVPFLLLLSSLLVLAIRLRIRRIREKEEAKLRQAELDLKNRQLVLSQRMELMGALATGTVHDLKNLMAVIIGYSKAISKKHQGNQEDYEEIEVIKKTAGTAVQMAKQILSFSRPKSHVEHVHVELRRELEEILDTLKVTQPKNIQILREMPAEPVHFPIHPARFQQVIMNLCLNAFDAMPYGGEIKISLTVSTANEIILKITDGGKEGIKPEHLDKLFDPLFTTKTRGKGTGLGLFVVKQIVDDYNGKIDVHSEPGKGTTFTIEYPRENQS